MRYPDIAIIGGRLAGSTAAAMPRACRDSDDLIDPHEVQPFDFRIEKYAATGSSMVLPDRNRRFGAALGHRRCGLQGQCFRSWTAFATWRRNFLQSATSV